MRQLDSYRTAFFDCDGVILDSNSIKCKAFVLALKDERKELVDEFIKYHKSNGGVSRYIKFEYFFSEIKRQSDYACDLERALADYAVLSENGLMECHEVPGIRDILNYFNQNNISCYVVSGGSEVEVNKVFTRRGLSKYFSWIYGSPLSKQENLMQLRNAGELHIPGVFFGDARSDMEAADKFGLDFVYISGRSEWAGGEIVCLEAGVSVYNDFKQISLK